MCMLDRVREQKREIMRMARKNKIAEVLLFGSCARKEEKPESDIDFLVSFEPGATLLDQVHMKGDLQALFGVSVDVVSKRGLSPFLGAHILEEAVPI